MRARFEKDISQGRMVRVRSQHVRRWIGVSAMSCLSMTAMLTDRVPLPRVLDLTQAKVIVASTPICLAGRSDGNQACPRFCRRPQAPRGNAADEMNRLYVIESLPTITGGLRRPPPRHAARRDRRFPSRIGRSPWIGLPRPSCTSTAESTGRLSSNCSRPEGQSRKVRDCSRKTA